MEQSRAELITRTQFLGPLFGISLLFGLYAISLYNYVLFHTIAEIFSIVIALSISMLIINSRRYLENGYFLVIGTAYLFVGSIDVLHTLAYRGMNVFQGFDSNLPTQLWIAARYLQGISLLIAPFFSRRKPSYSLLLAGYSILASLLFGMIFIWKVFPDCYREGVGLTPFKIYSEYAICLILLASTGLLFLKRKDFDRSVFSLLVLSVVFMVGSELAFTRYVSVYGPANLVGHYLKIIAFYLLYKAVIETAISRPFSLVFRDLAQREETLKSVQSELQDHRKYLEQLVEERTAELKKLNEELDVELRERSRADIAVKRSHEFCKTVINSMADAVSIINADDFRIVGFNSVFLKELGLREDAAVGRTCFELSHHGLDACNLPDFSCPLMETVRTGEHAVAEHVHYDREGRKIYVEVSTSPIKDEQGRTVQVVHVTRDITVRKQAEEDLKNSQLLLRSLSAHLEEVREEERKKIAREIHDELGQALTALKMDASWLRNKYRDHDLLFKKVHSMTEVIDSTIQAVKRIVTELRPGVLDDLGLTAAIEWQAWEFEKRTGIACVFTFPPEEIVLGRDLSTPLFRVFQEALTNIIRHAEATRVKICIEERGGEFLLTVEDNGKGITETQLANPQAFGIIGMRERVHFLGGRISIERNTLGGTTVSVIVPLKSEETLREA